MRNIHIIFALLTVLTLHATQRVEECIARFEQYNSVENANMFFRALDEEHYTDSLIIFSKPVHHDTICSNVWYWVADYYCNAKHSYRRSIEYAQKALPYMQQVKNEEWLSDCYALMSVSYFYLSDWDNAAKYDKLCYEIDVRSNDMDRISSSLNTLACIYQSAKQPETAEKYILKAIEYAKQADNPQRLAVLNGTASEIYHSMGCDIRALKHAQDAYDIEISLHRYEKAAIRQAQAGSALIGLKRHKEAYATLRCAIDTLKAHGNFRSLAITYRKIADTEAALNDTSAAIRHYQNAVDFCQKVGDLYNEAQAHAGLYAMLRKSKPADAMEHIDRYNEIKDSLYKVGISIALADFDAQYNNTKLKEQLQQKDDELIIVKKENSKILIITIVVICLLIILITVRIITRRYRIKQIAKLREEYERIINGEKAEQHTEEKTKHDKGMSEADTMFLDNVISIINAHLDKGDVSIDTIASELNLSAFQFRKRIMLITGLRPQEFVQNIKMTRACYLLDNRSDLPVNEVSQLCGYNDAANFIRSFKRIYGITPQQYRSRNTLPPDK